MDSKSADLQSKLARLHQDYARQLPNKVQHIQQAWQAVLASAEPTPLQELIQLCHTLAGSGASYGFQQVTRVCREIEQQLRDIQEQQKPLTEITRQHIQQRLDQLSQLAEQAPDNRSEGVSMPETPPPRLIYLLDETGGHANNIANQIRNYGYTIELFDELDLLQQQVQRQQPAVVIVHSFFENEPPESLDRLSIFSQSVPTLLVTNTGDIQFRLQAIRNNITDYFVTPINVIDLVDQLDYHSHQDESRPGRILIVDDSESDAEFYSLHLQNAGMEVRTINNPLQILEEIERFTPELILLDLHMPDGSGTELAQLVRQQDSNLSTPIVFLSAESDPERQMSAILRGDDFLSKPIQVDHLVKVLHSKVQRFRQLRAMMLRDSLTGLYNHTTLVDLLHRQLQRASRQHEPLSYIMLDIDHFKSVNDNYGHDVGDRVIKSLSRLLRQRLRSGDYVGRYGGEEFAVILPNTSSEQALKVIESIRNDFARLRQSTHEGEIFCTFSAGVADNRLTHDTGTLARSADSTLYRAKLQGRNRSLIAGQDDLQHADPMPGHG